METQHFVQQKTARTFVAKRSNATKSGAERMVQTPAGANQVRVDPPQAGVKSPLSRAEQLTRFVAQFQAEKARKALGNVGADLQSAPQRQPSAPLVNQAAASKVAQPASTSVDVRDNKAIAETVEVIDRARRQFSHAAGMSRTPVDSVISTKPAIQTEQKMRSEIVATVSEVIASEVTASGANSNVQADRQTADAQTTETQTTDTQATDRASVTPAAAIRQPFFAKTASNNVSSTRPEVVFETEKATATAPPASATTSTAPPAPRRFDRTLTANGISEPSTLEGNWNSAPMKNLAKPDLRQPQDTQVVDLPDFLVKEISDQHRKMEAEKQLASQALITPVDDTPDVDHDEEVASPAPTPEPQPAPQTKQTQHAETIPLEFAAWDVEDFRWPEVTDQILTHATEAMDQLTHYALDILTENENRIAVSSLRRREGASTIASVVTRWAVANQKRVLLVDGNLANPSLGQSVGLSADVSWLNLIRENLIPSEAIIRSKASGVCVMPLAAVVTPESFPGRLYDQLGALIEQVRHGFDLVLIDVGTIGQLSNEISSMNNLLDVLMIVDQDPSSNAFHAAKTNLLKSGVRKFIATQNSVGQATI